eukprot:TRINITY_DN211_c0_g1_i2.p1 TRINITY_DN211_c0_g1~~TRINITY_DN211_c0_g1_i2.p1  ORF type:complete len:267 (-),score=30.85 TRINITY_DN211_c0_g1_i2:25-825(-)
MKKKLRHNIKVICQKTAVLQVVLAILILAATFYYFLKSGYFAQLLNWIATLSWYGNVIFLFLYIIIAMPFAFGYVVLSLACGLIYGLWIGWLTIILGACAGFTSSFLICRWFLRDWTRSKIKQNKKLQILLLAIEANPTKFTVLMRYTPVPFGLQNAIIAVADIPFRTYFITSLFALLPEEFFWAYFGGTAAKSLADIVEGKITLGIGQKFALIAQVIVIGIILAGSVIAGSRAMKQMTEEVNLRCHDTNDFGDSETQNNNKATVQ